MKNLVATWRSEDARWRTMTFEGHQPRARALDAVRRRGSDFHSSISLADERREPMFGLGTRPSPRRYLQAVGIGAACALLFSLAGPAAAQPSLGALAPETAPLAAPAPYVDSSEIIANPERGLFDHNGSCDAQPFNEERIKKLREERSITLVRCIFYLEGYQAKPLDQAVFDKLNNRAAAAKRLGVKLVLRFAYSKSTDRDARVAMAESHIGQLASFLKANASVIHVLESGFVGKYGEGYYTHQQTGNGPITDDYGNAGSVTTGQWAARTRITNKLLSVLPAHRSIQVRTVTMKRLMYGHTVSPTGAPVKPGAARVGLHNDCLFGANGDQGTYPGGAIDYTFFAEDRMYIPVGGEICGDREPAPGEAAPPPEKQVHCAMAKSVLAENKWTHLSNGQGVWTRQHWADNGCMDTIERSLGYRLTLAGATFPAAVPRGQTFLARIQIRNIGYAAPIANRPVQLVLRNTATKAELTMQLKTAQPKRWYAGTSTLVEESLPIGAAVPTGTYEVFLRLPDIDPALRTPVASDPLNPYPYNIRLTTDGVWERDAQGKSTGLNKLARSIQIT